MRAHPLAATTQTEWVTTCVEKGDSTSFPWSSREDGRPGLLPIPCCSNHQISCLKAGCPIWVADGCFSCVAAHPQSHPTVENDPCGSASFCSASPKYLSSRPPSHVRACLPPRPISVKKAVKCSCQAKRIFKLLEPQPRPSPVPRMRALHQTSGPNLLLNTRSGPNPPNLPGRSECERFLPLTKYKSFVCGGIQYLGGCFAIILVSSKTFIVLIFFILLLHRKPHKSVNSKDG